MRVAELEIRIVNIPMNLPVWRAAEGEAGDTRNLIVIARDSDGREGYGEACPHESVTGESIASAVRDLEETIFPMLLGIDADSLESLAAQLLEAIDRLERNQQAAFCGAELACLDLAGRVFGRSSGELLGPVVAKEIRYTGVVSARELEGVQRYAAIMRKTRVAHVKVKLGGSLEMNRQILEVVRSTVGDDVQLRADASGAWTADEALRQLEALAAYDLQAIEQPLPGDDIEGMARVTAAGVTAVVADESLCSLDDARRLIEERACDLFNVRVSKCGGLTNAARVRDLARTAGVPCQLGAEVGETGILSAAGRQFGTRSEGLEWFEGSYGNVFLESDIVDPDVTAGAGGLASALEADGLGVTPLADTLDRYTIERRAAQHH